MIVSLGALVCSILVLLVCADSLSAQQPASAIDYRVLATNKTSTMQQEMQEAAAAGFHFTGVMGGDTSFGGSEVVVIMCKDSGGARYEYRLLATSKTSRSWA